MELSAPHNSPDPLRLYRNIFRESLVGMSVYDSSGQCVEANEAVCQLVGSDREHVLLQNYNTIESWKPSGLLDAALSAVKEDSEKSTEVTVTSSFGRHVTVNCRFSPFSVGDHKYLLLIADDVTEQRAVEEAKEHLVEQLREALAHVRTLRGIIPICASCKKIRDDEGYWEQIESYIDKHSDANFSHGICPECAERLYPDINPYTNS